jgi:transcriptional regulator with XRE-family HTH domain
MSREEDAVVDLAALQRQRKKNAVQTALVALRQRAGISQFQLAVLLGVTPVTTSRWETSHPPHGKRLDQLAQLAEERGARDAAQVFREARQGEQQLRAQYEHARLWMHQWMDPSDDFAEAIRHAWEICDDPRVRAHWDRLVDDLIYLLRHRVRYGPKELEETVADDPQLDLSGAPSRQSELTQQAELENLQDLLRRLIDYQKAEKRTATTKARSTSTRKRK